MGDPAGAARYALESLEPGGTVLLVEPFALDDHQANLTDNPMGRCSTTRHPRYACLTRCPRR